MLSTAITLAAETSEHGEPAIHPYWIGVIALGLLLVLLAAVVSFGGGREHS
jgi:hypothetical protein